VDQHSDHSRNRERQKREERNDETVHGGGSRASALAAEAMEGGETAILMQGGTMSYSRVRGGDVVGGGGGPDSSRRGAGAREVGGRQQAEEKVGLLVEQREEELEKEVVVLEEVHLRVQRGQFLVICGQIGAGKSTLLAALAEALPLVRGRVTTNGARAYAGQKAFVMTGSIRDNVLFQQRMDTRRYWDALQRAQLMPDLALLPQGDLTVVGTEGVQLSGGQRARVALARVLYADVDVVLLDDIMSALDAHTGAAVWRDALCWSKSRGKTVVLVTHQLQLLQRAEVDLVALLAGQRLVACAPFAEVQHIHT